MIILKRTTYVPSEIGPWFVLNFTDKKQKTKWVNELQSYSYSYDILNKFAGSKLLIYYHNTYYLLVIIL